MKRRLGLIRIITFAVFGLGLYFALPNMASAHCDTLNGPVITDAKLALETGDVTPVLKWIKKDYEAEVSDVFKKTMIVRANGPEAKEIADRLFFETLVRLHRAGEGEPFTGLKPTESEISPAIEGADRALVDGSIDNLIKVVTEDVAAGIRERYEKALKNKKHVNDSVEAGREYVEAYIAYVHYVERIHADAAGTAAHQEESQTEGHHGHGE